MHVQGTTRKRVVRGRGHAQFYKEPHGNVFLIVSILLWARRRAAGQYQSLRVSLLVIAGTDTCTKEGLKAKAKKNKVSTLCYFIMSSFQSIEGP